MDKNVVATWPTDFETGLPTVPQGEFTDFSEYPSSTQPARVRKLPILRGSFDVGRFDLNESLPTHIGWGMVPIGERAVALTFRLQRGPNVLYWLANPADKQVWKVIDTWAAAKMMVVAAEFSDGRTMLIARDFDLHPTLSTLRAATAHAERLTPEFIADATLAFGRDEIKQFASTDIPAFPTLQHVQACLVRTEHTGGVSLMLDDGAPGPDGPIADAVNALMKSMLQPDKLRH